MHECKMIFDRVVGELIDYILLDNYFCNMQEKEGAIETNLFFLLTYSEAFPILQR